MKECLRVLICGVVLWAVCTESFAQLPVVIPPNLRAAFSSLLTDDIEAQQSAIDEIAAAKAAVLIPALEAYSAGLLERRADGQLVVYQIRVVIRGTAMYPLVDAYTIEPLTDSDGSIMYAEGLGGDMLRADPAVRQLLSPLISELSIYHPDVDRRRAAIVDAVDRNTPELLEELKALRVADNGGAVTRTLTESIARMELDFPDTQNLESAVETLGDLGSSRAARNLEQALDRAESDGDFALVTSIEGALDRIESHQRNLRLAQHTFAGLSLGSILILLALGLSIIFGLMRVINLAHGEFMMVGAYTTFVVSELFKDWLPTAAFDYYFLVALPMAFLVAGFVGFLCEVFVIRHLYGRPMETLLATWGISLLLIQSTRVIFGDTSSLTPPGWLQGGWEVVPDLVLPLNRVFIIVFCGGAIAAVYYLISRTKFGLLLRATTQDREIAATLGVRTRRVDALTFSFGAGLAGLAGTAVPLFDKLNPNLGQGYIVDSFMVVVVGGVGKLLGVISAGAGLGFLTKYLEPWLEAVYGKLAVLGLIILFLQWRPSGLFPPKGRLEED
jgi:urea transport system permease protein